MTTDTRETLVFLIKWTVLGWFQRAWIALFGATPNRNGREERILIIYLHGLGDVITSTPALRYYRKYFAGKKISMAVATQTGFNKTVFGDSIDELIKIDARKFGTDPRYALQEIDRLRRIGFGVVINQSVSVKDKASALLSISLGAPQVVGYEGNGVELANPNNARYLRYRERHFFPHYTKLVQSIDKDFTKNGTKLRSAIEHHFALCAAVTGEASFPDASTIFNIDEASAVSARRKFSEFNAPARYVAFVVGAAFAARRWNIGRFAEVAKGISKEGFGIVLLGAPSEKDLGTKFAGAFGDPFVDMIGALTVMESAAVIRDAHCLVSNDTGPLHIAVALGTPSVCICGVAHLGMYSLYGRKGVNRWAYKDIGCLYDDWRCAATVPAGAPAPCVAAVSATAVIAEFHTLRKFLDERDPKTVPFEASFSSGGGSATL